MHPRGDSCTPMPGRQFGSPLERLPIRRSMPTNAASYGPRSTARFLGSTRRSVAFPEILSELKARGYKIVVVPATADRPKTVDEPQLWAAPRSPEQKVWPRTLVVVAEEAEPVLTAPAPANFGIEHFGGPTIKVALAQTFERQTVRDGDAPLPPVTTWPHPAAYSLSPQTQVLPVPGEYNFRYSRPLRLGHPDKPKLATKKPDGSKKDAQATSGLFPPQLGATGPGSVIS
jgi:hypothetical protein